MNNEKSIEHRYNKSKEAPTFLKEADLEELRVDDFEAEKENTEKEDEFKIAEIRASLGIEHNEGNEIIKKYLQDHLDLEEGVIARIEFKNPENLPDNYKQQYQFFDDERLKNIVVAIIPDDLWSKGNQPSESSAENNLILMKKSYFEGQGNSQNPDEIAWMNHEFAHCQNFLDSESIDDYEGKMQTFAFDDLESEYTYPNNLVEKCTFGKQFEYLKQQGKNREDILKMINSYYPEEDLPFFDRLLDDIYI